MPTGGQVENILSLHKRAVDNTSNNLVLYGPDGQIVSQAKQPLVAFPSAYALTREQEDDLIEHIFDRKRTLEAEMGRDVVSRGGGETWFVGAGPGYAANERGLESMQFLAKRAIYDLIYHNKMGWRKWCIGQLFAKSNLSLPLTRRVVRQMVARANAYFFGSDPWFGSYAATIIDKDLAQAVDRFAKYKVKGSGLVKTLRKAIKWAFVRGEGIVKTTHEAKEQVYQTKASILVDVHEKPVLDARGDYIFESDAWMPAIAPDPMTGQPAPTGQEVLRKDGVTAKPTAPVFVEKLVTRVIPIYQGPRSDVVYYRDILIPLQAPSVHEADIVIHLYDKPVMEFADMMRRANALGGGQSAEDLLASQEQTAADIRQAMEALSDMSASGDQPKAERNQPRPEMGEQDSGNTSGSRNPNTEIGEAYLCYDANGDGIAEEIVVFFDVATRRPLFYDYLANVFNNARRPFEVLRIHEVDGRWFGLGAVEMFEGLQADIDLQINRANFSQSEAGRVTIWDPSLTKEGQSNPHLQLNTGRTYTKLRADIPKDAILDYITLPEVKADDLMKRIEYDVQFVTTESGVANANDGAMAGLDSQKLATGINNITQSGNEMFGDFTDTLEHDVEQVLNNEQNLIFSRMNPVEVYDFFEGATNARQIAELNADDVRHLPMRVELNLTRTQGQQEVQSAMQFLTLTVGQTPFFELQAEVQARLAPIFITVGKALKIPEADVVFQPMAPATPAGTPPTAGSSGGSSAVPTPTVQAPAVPPLTAPPTTS